MMFKTLPKERWEYPICSFSLDNYKWLITKGKYFKKYYCYVENNIGYCYLLIMDEDLYLHTTFTLISKNDDYLEWINNDIPKEIIDTFKHKVLKLIRLLL